MVCFFCKDIMKNGATKHFTDLGSCIIIIKNVPCHTCTQCGEVVFELDVGERLEQIIEKLKNSLTEVAIVHYSDAVTAA